MTKKSKSKSTGIGAEESSRSQVRVRIVRVAHSESAGATSMDKVVTFGRVTVRAVAPSDALVRRNITAGSTALSRARDALLKPGVQVRLGAKVPLYHADPDAPEFLIQTLGKRKKRGRFVGGHFEPV